MSERSERLFADALALPAAEREAFLERTCPRDPRLRAELLSLLARGEAAETFFGRLGEAVLSDAFWTAEGDGSGDLPSVGAEVDLEAFIESDALPVGHALGHYTILERMGSGGMGTLYRAHDRRLGRPVALKFLSPQPSTDQESRNRLLREARAAAALEHPNVCAVHEVGEPDDGRPFLAMPFYRGETLKERLRRGPLRAAEALDVALQLARGLEAAHACGIVHGDVKPANIMLTADGTVKLLDFGLADTVRADRGRVGGPWGTVLYMSPETVRGEPTDPRSDLWSVGVVLYQMLAGVPPFRATSELAILRGILLDEPEPVPRVALDTPAPLAAIVGRLLQKDPQARYGSASALREELERAAIRVDPIADGVGPARQPGFVAIAGLAAVTLALAAGGLWLAEWGGGRPSATARHGDGLPEVMQPPTGAGSNATRGPVAAAKRQEALRRETRSVAAYELYLRGSDPALLRSDAGVLRGVQYFQQAIALDSGYAAAHAGLAIMYVSLLGRDRVDRSAREVRALAERAASRAVVLEDSLAEAHAALALARLYSRFGYPSAEAEFARALELDPTRSVFHEWLAQLLIMNGRPAEALRAATRAVDDDPLSPSAHAELAHALLANGRADEALVHLDAIGGLSPPLLRAAAYRAQAYAMKGMWSEATAPLRERWKTGRSATAGLYGYILGRAGRLEEARLVRDDLVGRWQRGAATTFSVGLAEAGLGDYDRAFAWLDRAIDDGSATQLNINIMSPVFEELRAHPRFDRLRGRLGLDG